ncbi:olfactory receptor 8D1-like [Hyperolius riggenbachi]|uniref:olfactory receptor 8D1-like n=1 Tax=Hyperolius riggenbachi TaxID=752182 RepID=UPI0035A3B819
MNAKNQTVVTYLIIEGFSDVQELHLLIFLLVLLIYLITLGGNMIILLLVCLDSQLHTPMYFFLCNLSLLDIASSSVTLHKILVIFVTGDNVVPFTDCITQLYVFSWLCTNELILLTVMGYDRYVAICNPLRYPTIMNSRVCVGLAILCWSISLLQPLPMVSIVSRFSCYTSNIINHFFCDLMPLLNLTCNDTSVLRLLLFTQGAILLTLTPFVLTCISYSFIIAAITRIKSSTGRSKAFYTCSSHLGVVILLYVTLICQYFTPSGTLKSRKLFSLMNTAVVPMLNPFIYTLKNKDVKLALHRKLKCFMTIT